MNPPTIAEIRLIQKLGADVAAEAGPMKPSALGHHLLGVEHPTGATRAPG